MRCFPSTYDGSAAAAVITAWETGVLPPGPPDQPTAYMAHLMAIAMVGLVVVIATGGDSALRVPPSSPMVDLLASNRERREGRVREVCR